MTANQFITEILKSGTPLTISGETISGQVDIQTSLVATGIIIEDCIFEDGFFIENIDLNCGIKFIGCDFKKNLSINNCTARNYDQAFNFDSYHIEFKDTKIQGLYFNGNNQIERGVRISEKSEIKRIQVRTLISNKGSFAIEDSSIEGIIDISQAQLNGDFSIRNNSTIKEKVRVENLRAGSIVFTDSDFLKDIHIWAGNIGSLTFNDGKFEDDLSISAVPISSYLTVIGTEFKKSISFNIQDDTNNKTGKLTKVYIQSGKFGEQFIINGGNNEIDKLTIDTSKQLEGDLYFNSCNIIQSKVSGNNYNSNIVFNHSNFNKLNFDFFNNYSTVSIISAKSFNEESELIIAHSNLGKTHLFNTFLNTFNKVGIYNSVLTEIITANVTWFKDENLNPDISESSGNYTYKKEIYRQLKFALEKQGDRITSLKFKALEMSAFKSESFSKVKKYKRIFNIDRFVLWVGQSNNFGQHWLKPALIAIGFTLFFYALMIVGLSDNLSYIPNLSCESIRETTRTFWDNAYAIPQLLNPTHILSRVFKGYPEIGFLVYLWDYLLKIILAFFIFQVISAFRKYMK